MLGGDQWNNQRSRIWHGWTNAVPIDDALRWQPPRGVPSEAGAYVLSLHNPHEPKPIRRLLGTDRFGVLDIGESRALRGRIAALHRCATRRSSRGHSAGWRYAELRLEEALGGQLFIAWCVSRTWKQLEARIMTAYLNAFGELPPLNYKFNWALLPRP